MGTTDSGTGNGDSENGGPVRLTVLPGIREIGQEPDDECEHLRQYHGALNRIRADVERLAWLRYQVTGRRKGIIVIIEADGPATADVSRETAPAAAGGEDTDSG